VTADDGRLPSADGTASGAAGRPQAERALQRGEDRSAAGPSVLLGRDPAPSVSDQSRRISMGLSVPQATAAGDPLWDDDGRIVSRALALSGPEALHEPTAASLDTAPRRSLIVSPGESALPSTPPRQTPGQPIVSREVRERLGPAETLQLQEMERTGLQALRVVTSTGTRWYRPAWMDRTP